MTISVALTKWKLHVRTAVQEINAKFPTTSAGTYVGHDPSEALAADFMIPGWENKAGIAVGDALAKSLATVATAKRLGIWYVIWRGRIWSMTRPAAGWLPYFDRNNANPSRSHKNHVHVSFYAKAPAPPVEQPKPTYGDDTYAPAKPWVVYLDRLVPGVEKSDSVWWLQKALGIKPRTAAYGDAEKAAIKRYQVEVLKDDERYADGILGPKQAVALFGSLVKVEESAK